MPEADGEAGHEAALMARPPKKTFLVGEMVEVQPDVGKPHVRARYVKSHGDEWKGWHAVDLFDQTRWIDIATGMETTKDNPNARETRHLSVPTQRIRKTRT